MADFNPVPDTHVMACIESFLAKNWTGFGKPLDVYCSPYTTTADQYFILDKLPAHPEVSVFTGGTGRAFKARGWIHTQFPPYLTAPQPVWSLHTDQIFSHVA